MSAFAQKVFEIEHIFESIINLLIFNQDGKINKITTKVLRLVSKQWRSVVMTVLYQHVRQVNSFLSRDCINLVNLKDPQLIQKFVACQQRTEVKDQSNILPFTFAFEALSGLPEEYTSSFQDILTKCGYGMVRLELDVSKLSQMGIETLPEFQLPCLRQIELTHSSSGDTLAETLGQEQDIIKWIHRIFQAAYNSPLSIKFNVFNDLTENFTSRFRFPKSVTNLDIYFGFNPTSHVESVLLGNKQNFCNLSCLSLTLNPYLEKSFEKNVILEVLTQCADTIQQLYFKTSWPDLSKLHNHYFEFPPVLKNLKVLKVEPCWGFPQENAGAVATLKSINRLPELKEFQLATNSTNQLDYWTTHFSSKALRTVNISVKNGDDRDVTQFSVLTLNRSQMQRVHWAYPNITKLNFTIGASVRTDGLEYIFAEMGSLKYLRFIVGNSHWLRWDAVLTGCSSENIAKFLYSTDKLAETQTRPGIGNLKGLETFEINAPHFVETSVPHDRKITDLSFELAFLKMENLRLIRIGAEALISVSEETLQKWENEKGRSVIVYK